MMTTGQTYVDDDPKRPTEAMLYSITRQTIFSTARCVDCERNGLRTRIGNSFKTRPRFPFCGRPESSGCRGDCFLSRKLFNLWRKAFGVLCYEADPSTRNLADTNQRADLRTELRTDSGSKILKLHNVAVWLLRPPRRLWLDVNPHLPASQAYRLWPASVVLRLTT